MKPSIQTLGQILYSPSQYIIPVFQRNYRWEEPQWEKLWESLEEIQQPEKRGNHFMGFLVFVPELAQPGQNTTFHVIDGQQRLTSLSILLTAIRNCARRHESGDLADEVHGYYLVHPLKKGEEHYRVLPKERDHDTYLAIITGKGEPTGRVAEALAFFEGKLNTVAADDTAKLRHLFNVVAQRLEFMCATLETENAYNIFKSLNSTGVPLGAADLIRNFMFMHVPPREHDEFDADLWAPLESKFVQEDGSLDDERFARFLRDFLMSAGRYVSPRETFSTFEERYEATGFSPKVVAQTLTAYCKHYEVISGDVDDTSEEVTRALAALNALESSTTYPLILSLFEQRAAGKIDSSRLAHGISMLTGFIMRRFICGESSRGYGPVFVRAISPKKRDEGEATPVPVDPVLSLEQYLLKRGWPDDRRFEAVFVTFPIYERGYAKHVLETLERARGHKEPADLTDASIEHIMPQTLSADWYEALGSEADRIQADWQHTPGNLTLSGYNLELWNHGFAVKRDRYRQSNIVLTRELAEYPQWKEHEIKTRGERLAREARAIWIGPEETLAPVEAEARTADADTDDTTTDRHELRRRFWGGLLDHLKTNFPDLPDFEVRPWSTIRLPSAVRHVGFELRFSLRQKAVGIDVWFWREESLPVWHQLKDDSTKLNELMGATWRFELVEGRESACMFLERPLATPRSDKEWPAAYTWLGDHLQRLYEHVAPVLRDKVSG